jgi:hypothetical protein
VRTAGTGVGASGGFRRVQAGSRGLKSPGTRAPLWAPQALSFGAAPAVGAGRGAGPLEPAEKRESRSNSKAKGRVECEASDGQIERRQM